MHVTLRGVMRSSTAVSVRYAVRPSLEAWVLPEGTVPESIAHDTTARRLCDLLDAWVERAARPVRVARNLAVRWLREDARIGVDPDLCVLDPPPPRVEEVGSLKLWEPGCTPPSLSVEIVSRAHPHKDYSAIQDRYAAMGTAELVVVDPQLLGPAALGGPVPVQVWRRDAASSLFERVHFGDGPAFSEVLRAWIFVEGGRVSISDDAAGAYRWRSAAERAEAERLEKERERAEKERERAEKERERAEKERERAARQDLERRLARLEAAAGRR